VARGDFVRTLLRGLGVCWLPAVIVLAWEAASASGVLRPAVLPAFHSVVAGLARWYWDGHWIVDAGASVVRVLAGVAAASVLGVAAGATVAMSAGAQRALTPVLELVRPIPPIAWIPLAIVWFGIGSTSAIFIVTLGAFFPIFTGVQAGIASVRVAHVNVARGLGAGRRLIVTDVLLPAALPSILAGIRTGLGVGWMTLIAAELVGAQSGLGYTIQLNRLMLQIEDVMAGMLTIGIIGLVMNRAVVEIGRRVVPWTGDMLFVQPATPKRHGR